MKAPGYHQFQNYQERTEAQVVRDLNIAHDRIRTLTEMHNAGMSKLHLELERSQKRIALYGWIGVLFFVSSVLQWAGIWALCH